MAPPLMLGWVKLVILCQVLRPSKKLKVVFNMQPANHFSLQRDDMVNMHVL